jgi:predicted nucleotidyltransferase
MPGTETGLLSSIVTGLSEELGDDLVAVVLFGSQVRREAREGSDWDVLVVAHGLPGRTLERVIRLKRMLPSEHRGEVSLLAKTPEEFVSSLPDLYLDIAVDGVILYDTDGFMEGRLRSLRALLQRKGLRREREGRDLIWRWREPPPPDWSLGWEEAP